MGDCKSRMMGVEEVSEMLGTSKGYAYKIIKTLNAERESQGFMTIPGKVVRDYFEKRIFSDSPRPDEAAGAIDGSQGLPTVG